MTFILSTVFSGCTDSKNEEVVSSVSDENIVGNENIDETNVSDINEFPTPEDRKISKNQDEAIDVETDKDTEQKKNNGKRRNENRRRIEAEI